jgi:hypothetical protein
LVGVLHFGQMGVSATTAAPHLEHVIISAMGVLSFFAGANVPRGPFVPGIGLFYKEKHGFLASFAHLGVVFSAT